MCFIILFCSGCTVNYKIDIDNYMRISEDIEIVAENDVDIRQIDEFNLHVPINKKYKDFAMLIDKVEDVNYYNIDKNNDSLRFNYYYSDKDIFFNSTIVNRAYDLVSFTSLEGKLVLSTSSEFLLFNDYKNLTDVTIEINSKYKLIETNADEVKKHKYIWHINKDNASKKSIYLSLNNTVDDRTFLEKLKDGEYTNMFTLSIILGVLGSIIYFILRKKSLSINKI